METPTAAETTSTQLFGVLYITLTGMVDSMIPTSGPWSLLGQSMSYIINLAPILWWDLPAGLAQPCPKPSNASTYAWFPDTQANQLEALFYTEFNHLQDKATLTPNQTSLNCDCTTVTFICLEFFGKRFLDESWYQYLIKE
ncbi:hypothetical protein DSO57_1012716 [Entomophthora muscae]|uniref:Uncharacterized protein n=1 Tax=Entomophthora muscae TaxID=34485 RepID=A0ACC2T655_9FUNG|nr:hypothetical protein DSO57_1012716 [Entomophthora muscae]